MTVHPPCDECGFAAETFVVPDVAETIRGFGRRYRAPLTRFLPGEDGDAVVRQRPDETTWSALEYAAHMRDVIMLWGWGLNAVLKDDHPVIPAPDQSELDDISSAYATLDPPPASGPHRVVGPRVRRARARCARVDG